MQVVEELATGGDGSGASYAFAPLPTTAFPAVHDVDAKDALTRWNLQPFMQAAAFRFDKPFSAESAGAFLHDLFASAAVQELAPVCTAPGQWGGLGTVAAGGVKYSRLATTVLRLDFFDRLKEAGIVRAGDVAKCLDVQCGDILVGDRLRTLLLDESCEDWDLFTEAERSELIFHVLKRLAIGGGMNQYDDSIEPYLKLTKAMYKDLVAVNRNAAGQLQVSSHTFAVEAVAGGSASLFPRPGPHNFCYVSVDPVARHVKLWYAAWFPMM